MQESKEILEYLNERFKNVRKTDTGFKFNVNELDRMDMASLLSVPNSPGIVTKRSGNRLVVIITL